MPWASAEMSPGASLAGNRNVPVQTSPCQSEKTIVESPAWVETRILRTESLVSKNQVRSPNKWPSTGTGRLWHRSPFLATGTQRGQMMPMDRNPA